MYRTRRPCFALLLLAALVGQPATAQLRTGADSADADTPSAQEKVEIPAQLPNHIPTLKVLSLQAFQNSQYADFVRVLEHARTLRPDDPQLMAQLVVGYAQIDNKPAAYTLMIQMQQQGLAFDFDSIPQTEPIRNTQVYDHISKLLKEADQPYGFAETAFTLPASLSMPEAVTWDPVHQQFIVATVREGRIVRYTAAGEPASDPAPFDTEQLWAVFGLAVDAERHTLWASTTAVGQWEGYRASDYGRAALVAFDLRTGEQKQRYEIVPDGRPHGLGNISLAADGTVFVADSRQPMMHVLRPGSDQLEALFTSDALLNIRGIAYSDAHKLLYVLDRELGIAMWSEARKELYRMHKPTNLNLSGSEGLNLWNNHLIVIQNGINPARVIQIRLTDDGLGMVTNAPLVAALDSFNGPSYGTVVDNRFYFLAANHWPVFDTQGNRLPGTKIDPVPVLEIPLAPLEETELPANRAKFRFGGKKSDGEVTQDAPGINLESDEGTEDDKQ